MKTKHLFFVGMLFVANLFNACSNEGEELLVGSEGNNKLSAAYDALLADDKPYISPGMQMLIDKLDTATVVLPIEELIPNIETILAEDTMSVKQSAATRTTASSGMFTGYSNKSFLFQNKQVSVTAYDSPLKSSLDLPWAISGTVYLTAIAVWYNVFLDEGVSYFEAEAEAGDFTGIAPNSLDEGTISNDTYFSLGFSCDEKYAGYSYRLTTYLLVISGSTSIYNGYVLPYKRGESYSMTIDWFCESLEWRYNYVP